MRKLKIFIITLGCSKNTVDSERLMNQLEINNFRLCDSADNADIVIINTCGFIEDAKKESIDTIMEAVQLKNLGKIKKVIVIGCLSERYKKDLETEIPEVDNYFGVEKYEEILEELGGTLKYELIGERKLSASSHSVYLKISEGCDNPCSFCAIPLIRGAHKSRPMEELINEAKSLAEKGAKELIIIGQDTTDYGIDLYKKRNLAELLHKLSSVEGIEWIRLMYAYPSHFPDDLIKEIASNEKICKYIDIPLQHISDNVLKSMRRGITKRRTIELINKLRKHIPDIVLRTTLIVGFPNESEDDFNELVEFISEFKFERVGVFTYSPEEDTLAFGIHDRLSKKEKDGRKRKLMKVQSKISAEILNNKIGKQIKVIVDTIDSSAIYCRTQGDAPEVDGEVIVERTKENYDSKSQDRIHRKTDFNITAGNFLIVEITDSDEHDLFAKLI